ncbi:Mitochondrial Protein Translocase (MPT) Family [Achlya hypogyna]|uniref:Mitochondrial Protein Translocase (MPT) Family n=1 Tax=Achlya hypogyna TaxID=1202772 RepID=A0A1V9ZAV9_ACHHY|nr:Mitochondrial Protein Translocase (MPT) Family [Achlya hypogyna]
MTLVAIPTAARAENPAAFLVEAGVLHEEGPFYLHVQDKGVVLPDVQWQPSEEDLLRAAYTWWLAHASVATVTLGIALTRRQDVANPDSDMEMLTVAETSPVKPNNALEDDFIEDVSAAAPVATLFVASRAMYHGVAASSCDLAGYLSGAEHVAPEDLLTTETDRCRWLLPIESLKAGVFSDVDYSQPINVLGFHRQEAALVAMTLLLSGHPSVRLCLFELDPTVLSKLPGPMTATVFSTAGVLQPNTSGDFDLSASAPVPAENSSNAEIAAAFDAEVAATTKKVKPMPQVARASREYREAFFTMPLPLPKAAFLEVAAAIYRATSLVLAPLGVLCPNPNPNLTETSMLELKTKHGHILQEIIEVVSDMVYADFDVDESIMAMSAQAWLHDVNDAECNAAMSKINQLGTTLRDSPAVVELRTTLAPANVVATVGAIVDGISASLAHKVPWALTPAPLPDFSHPPPPLEHMTMYPTVVYALGYQRPAGGRAATKQSTLQVKAKVQAVYEGVRSAVAGIKDLDGVQLQALVECLPPADRADIADLAIATFGTHHVVNDDVFVDPRLTQAAQARFRAVLSQGSRAQSRGDVEDAVRHFSTALNCVPLHHASVADALAKRAMAHLSLGNLEQARADSQAALAVAPFCMEAYAALGALAEKAGDHEDALQMHVLAFILGGSRAVEQADVIERVSKHVGRAKAKEIWAAMEMRHDLPSRWLVDSYFQSFYRDADYPISTVAVSKLSELPPETHLEPLLVRAIHHKRARRYKEAQTDFAALAAHVLPLVRELDDPAALDSADRKRFVIALNLHASFLYIAGDVNSALGVIDEALRLDPEHVNSVLKKAGFLVELGDFDDATELFAEATSLDPNNADIYLHQGQMELILCEYPAAVSSLRRAMARCETMYVTHVSYGMALYKAGSVYQSLDVFKTALELFPESHEVRLFYGDVLSDRGDYGQAMAHLKTAYEMSPECPLHLLNAGRIFVATNDAAHAIAHFEEALRLDAKSSAGHLDLAQVYFAQGNVSEAMKHFDAAIDTCRFLPEVEDACACRAVALMQLRATEILGVDLRHMLKNKNK